LFITDEGKVYVARDTKQGKRKLESLWSDDKHKIGVLVTDAKTGKTFAFTKPRDPKAQPKDEVYFELADPIKPKPFDSAKLTATSAPEPLNTAIQHARFLVAEKLIAEK
jgi:hypothetical protein